MTTWRSQVDPEPIHHLQQKHKLLIDDGKTSKKISDDYDRNNAMNRSTSGEIIHFLCHANQNRNLGVNWNQFHSSTVFTLKMNVLYHKKGYRGFYFIFLFFTTM